ncbi:Structural maintenance of [Teratosphaeria destructans]|uniref:Structural maintenance of chromosomes protein n=1 Tax=Teratosphaeria destructans TaxID=418781 RepID=A0A9W7SPW2_9PEZI|nr:Structural maintenance of [Teratosphaeria destructans]
MYIKQIIIQGFKSYKDQTVIEPFSPKHNVIVGRNGSGKSNFFAAIRFVLSDQYTQMGREERQALLHEGTGAAVMSAYVEVIFDNSDGRFPTDTEEVVLRRTIGQKKDEYSLNRKNTTKNEVMNMLETAGFSRSNPYYIVPQGRITAITNMKDAERLELLKGVAGTHVYEQRRSESTKLMDETRHKREKIDETLDHIKGRLDELEEEKEELRAFQDNDRERRCLEYTIHHREQEAVQEQLDLLDERREDGVEQTDGNREALEQTQDQLEAIENEIGDLRSQITLLTEERAELERERKEAAKQKAKIELDVQTMLDNESVAQQTRTDYADTLREVQEQLQQREAELAGLLPEYNAKREQERALKQQMQNAEATVSRLYAKQGRQNQFRSKKERDTWLRQQIDDVNVALAARKAISMQTTEDVAELEQQIAELESSIAELRSRLENRGDEQQGISTDVVRAKEERDRLQDQRKELWREEAKLTSVIDNARQELEKAERFLSHMMDQNTSRGLASVRRIVREHDIEGAYGPLGELFEFSDKYKTAVEVTAGTSLFNYVVDTDDTATRILDILKREHGGRITFVPLNQIRTRPVNIPQASDAVHLVKKLKYDMKYDKAFQQVFGRTIVCPNLQVAAQYARTHQITAITPEGDRSDKKGALTGGYHDIRSSRTDGMRRLLRAREEYEKHAQRKREIDREVETINQQITKAMSEIQKVEQKRMQLEQGYGPLRDELRRREAELNYKRDELDRKHRARENVEDALRTLGEQLSGFESELASDFKKALSHDEERQLDRLNNQIPELHRQYIELSGQRAELEARKSTIEIELRENLRPRLDQLQDSDEDAGGDRTAASATRLKERQRDLKRITKALEQIAAKLEQNETDIDEAQQQLQAAEANRVNAVKQIEELSRTIKNQQSKVERAAKTRARLTDMLTEVGLQIRNLGVLPEVAFSERYTNMASNVATARLHKVQDALKKYGHVNKKAFEQFAQFERQREVLETRRKELDSSDVSIRELIDVLDQRKDEAIERTFRQVSREFARVFESLVPAGRGRLVIQRRADKQVRGEDDESEDEQRQGGGVENYIGVGISVSFNSKHDEQQRIQQLSGGQKSLCALALVFAIQASDPAPFYLFDEIDANLDAQYRTAVAEMLKRSAEGDGGGAGGQFICTTFRPEMVLVADKCYGVSYLRKASTIDVVDREDALGFVEGQIGAK